MNKNVWDFATIVAVLVFLFFVVKELAPYLKQIGVHADADGSFDFTAFTHDRNEIADANRPLVLQGN